jgi:tungstate transport system ATP-binding protein
MIELRNIIKDFGKNRVLDIEDLRFAPGRIYALVGHNGAGKTTLLRCIAGLEKPSAGTMSLNIDNSKIGFCFQKPFLFRGSVGGNISWGLRKSGSPETVSRVRDIAARLGIDHLLHRNAKLLSSGEAHKTAFARALIRNPALLLADEPAANLDPHSVTTMEEEIRRFGQAGGTVIIATHMTDHALRFSQEIVRLEMGKVSNGEVVNVLEGAVKNDRGACRFIVNDTVELFCAPGSPPGRHRISLCAKDIVLSREPVESSMMNRFMGIISGMRLVHEAVEVTIDIGIPLRATVTAASCDHLRLKLGERLCVAFKATAVTIL